MEIIFPVYEFSFAKGATRLLRGASRLAELSLINELWKTNLQIIFEYYVVLCRDRTLKDEIPCI